MIQRIQTIYLFISFLLISGFFITPIAEFLSAQGDVFLLTPFSISNEVNNEVNQLINTWPLAVLVSVIAIIFLVTIFLYKKRNIQARLTILNMLLLFGLAGTIYFYVTMGNSELNGIVSYSIFNISIPVSIVLTFISNKRIRLDEALVKSYDRIR